MVRVGEIVNQISGLVDFDVAFLSVISFVVASICRKNVRYVKQGELLLNRETENSFC